MAEFEYTRLCDERRNFLKSLTAEDIKKASEIIAPLYYFEPEGTNIQLKDLDSGLLNDKQYANFRASGIRGGCVDVFMACKNNEGDYGVFLIERMGNPARGLTWPIGGAKKRHLIGPEKSIHDVIERECGKNLSLEDYVFLNPIGAAWGTSVGSPEYGGRGVHDEGLAFYVRVNGTPELSQKNLEKNPIIVTPKMWNSRGGTPRLNSLHAYVEENMWKSQALLSDFLKRP